MGEPYIKCRNNNHPLMFSENYTMPLCEQECKEKYVVEKCGCRDSRYGKGMLEISRPGFTFLRALGHTKMWALHGCEVTAIR